MLPRDHAGKARKLRILSKRLERMIGNGSFYALPFWRRYALVRRVKRLSASLLGLLSPAAAKVLIAGAASAALIAACCPGTPSSYPAFAARTKNPFDLASVAAPAAPCLADIDDDGDFDLFAGGGGEGAGFVRFFENTGCKWCPEFAAATDYPNLQPSVPYCGGVIPVLAPVKNAPLYDAFIGHSNGFFPYLEFFENDGNSLELSTVPADLPTFTSDLCNAAVVDIDGDGLLDVFMSTSDGTTSTIEYYRNTGTASAPAFTDQSTTLGLVLPAGAYGYPVFVDIDADDDFEAFVGNELGNLYFFRNTGTAASPVFAAPSLNPFGITTVPAGPAIPSLADIDHDGDLDLFVGDGNGDLWFFKNKDL